MHHKRGFLLIECCVYLAVCAILTVTLMRWIAQTFMQAGLTVQAVERGMMGAVAHDVLMRDLQAAPCNRSAWAQIQSDRMVWKQENITIGWYNDHNQLIRKEGTYDIVHQHWGKHHTSTVVYGVSTFVCKEQGKGDSIQSMKVTLGLEGGEPAARVVRLRNGRVS